MHSLWQAALVVVAVLVASPAVGGDAVPNLDGIWLGDGAIGLGLGSSFGLMKEIPRTGGIEAYIGGMLAANSTCNDRDGDQATYSAPWSAIKLTTNGTVKQGMLRTLTRLASDPKQTGSVSQAQWTSDSQTHPKLARVTSLPDGSEITLPNAFTGCLARPTTTAAEVAGAPGNSADGSHVPVVPSMFDELSQLAAPGGPPFLRGYFAGPAAVGMYTAEGYSFANMVIDGQDRETKRIAAVQGQFFSHVCTGPYKYRATTVQIGARASGDTSAAYYCEAGEFDPKTGVLKVWIGDPKGCPRTGGGDPPTFTSVKIGKLVNSPDGNPCKSVASEAMVGDDGEVAGGALQGPKATGAAGGVLSLLGPTVLLAGGAVAFFLM